MKKSAIVVCGPTASGKTQFAHNLATKINGEIVNCDSMQLYKEVPILTSSPSQDLKNQIPYHLYNTISIYDQFSVLKYINLASEVITNIIKSGSTPIITGGTGMYINALMFGYNQIPDITVDTKLNIKNLYESEGLKACWSKLCDLDQIAKERLKSGDTKRILRALEVIIQTGKSIFEFHAQDNIIALKDLNFKVIHLNPIRNFLYHNCDQRLEQIFQNGAIKEVHNLKLPVLAKPIGISQIKEYIQGSITLDQAIILAKQKTRQYAKRQITWFNTQIPNKITLSYSNTSEFEELMLKNT